MPLDIQRIRALCFDVDGTLSDTDDQYVARFARLLRPLRFIKDPHKAARRFVMAVEAPGNALIGVPDTLGLDDELMSAVEWIQKKLGHQHKKTFLLISSVDRTLAALAGRYPLSVVSARDARSTRAFLDQFDLTRHFRTIVTAQTAEHTKPYPDPILHAAREMGVTPESCLMIGDTTVDIRAGKRAGAQTVGVLCGFGERAELEKKGADLILEGTAELEKALLKSGA